MVGPVSGTDSPLVGGGVTWGSWGTVQQADCSGEEAVLVARGPGPDGPEPLARREGPKEIMSWMRGVGYNPGCPPPGPGDVQLLERREVAADHLLC